MRLKHECFKPGYAIVARAICSRARISVKGTNRSSAQPLNAIVLPKWADSYSPTNSFDGLLMKSSVRGAKALSPPPSMEPETRIIPFGLSSQNA